MRLEVTFPEPPTKHSWRCKVYKGKIVQRDRGKGIAWQDKNPLEEPQTMSFEEYLEVERSISQIAITYPI
jgi:hypothetical protein